MQIYRIFSWEIDSAIQGLMKLIEVTKTLDKENPERPIEGVTEGHQRSLPYGSFIPETVANLKYVKEWFENQKKQTEDKGIVQIG